MGIDPPAAAAPRSTSSTASLPEPIQAEAELIRGLQLACSGELGAILAYIGHGRALRGRPERAVIRRILRDEVHHRRRIGELLEELGSAPDSRAERKMRWVGTTIACLCRFGGWFFPMYGAARLESDNIGEYEIAARLALLSGHAEWIDELLEMAEVEWDHERDLRELAASHFLWRLVPHWPEPPPRRTIRQTFASFRRAPCAVHRRRSLLVR